MITEFHIFVQRPKFSHRPEAICPVINVIYSFWERADTE